MPPTPRRRERITAIAVAFAVFGAAAALVVSAFLHETPSTPAVAPGPSTTVSAPGSPTSLDASLEAPPDGSVPNLTLTFGSASSTFSPNVGGWGGANISSSPAQTFDATIDPGLPLTLTTNASGVGASLWIVDRDQSPTGQSIPLDLSSGSAVLPDQAGLYQLRIGGGWSEGKVDFSVGVTIGTPPNDWPPPVPTPSTAAVPDVVGLTLSQAQKVLTDASFESVYVVPPAGASKPEIIGGVVTAQDPAAGTETHVTTIIKLTVSTTGQTGKHTCKKSSPCTR
ncbi:MAG TPA: PASTA domain-containing protein [Actinomycetota bacterium]|nr:PASTA domain-containing protein [Actinomycetota bacterium]